MKIIGIGPMFIAATVLVFSSSSFGLPTTLSINIVAFIDNNLNNKGLATETNPKESYRDTAVDIVSKAEERLNQLFGQDATPTKFELRFTGVTKYSCGRSKKCHSSMIEKYVKSRTDLYVFFEKREYAYGMIHPESRSKICHLEKELKTVTLPGNGRITESPTRDLVFFIGHLLGMMPDRIRLTNCPMGNMIINQQKQIPGNEGVPNKWNKCNREQLKDFYGNQIANEPRGFCLDKDFTIPAKIDIAIHVFYDQLYDDASSSSSSSSAEIKATVEKAETILNEENTLGATFELNVVHRDLLDPPPTSFEAMETISRDSDKSAANFYVFLTNKKQMPEAHPNLAGKICSGDRAHRTVSLTQEGFDKTGVARQLVYYIGRALGMDDYDELLEYYKPLQLACPRGYMDFLHKTDENTWDVVYEFFNSKVKQWNRCNAEDLSSFYRQFLGSDNMGAASKSLCVTAPMTITIDAIRTATFTGNYKSFTSDEASILEIVKEASNTLNQDPASFGITFHLVMTSTASFILPRTWYLYQWGSTSRSRPAADLHLIFAEGDDPHSEIESDGHFCTSPTKMRMVLLKKNTHYSYKALGNQLAYYIGQLLGMKRDEEGRESECPVGLMGIMEQLGGTPQEKGKKWGKQQSWNSCNVKDVWKSYSDILRSQGSFCLEN